ncbi:ABC-2 type transport system permease protein [Deinococcus metalli]|uniref:ABC transporter permease n=1 Tax=Deinococcus metalli TaxID=1141878 RepID=A0A7W8NRV4_9DEIO|nr:ABC transporter permease [Deinococcus metalli]MBB5378260.1 ABC-2 type transport system permease protein [Deinococcus metalli]GHF57243.1 ABC transporter permease [Deinococcus metalli]
MRRYLRLVRIFTGATVAAQLEYRANFVGAVLASLGQVGVALLGIGVLFGQPGTTSVGGWSFREALLVTGFYMLTEGFIAVFVQPNMSRIAEAVRTGAMDFTLLKPIDAQFGVSTRHLNVLRVPDMVIGVGLIVSAASALTVTPGSALAAALLYASALVIVYCIWLGLSTTAFWFVKTQNVTELFSGVFGAARFPATAFPVPVRFLLTFVVPVAFVTTVPAQALTGQLGVTLALTSPLVAAALLLVTRLFWRYAVASYTSASS